MYIKREVSREDFRKLMRDSVSIITNEALDEIYNYIEENEKDEFVDGWEFDFQEVEEGFKEVETLQEVEENRGKFKFFLRLKNGNWLLSNCMEKAPYKG